MYKKSYSSPYTLKQKYKGIILKDGKRLCGIGRLTNKAINTAELLRDGDSFKCRRFIWNEKRYNLNYSSLLSK